MRGLKYEAPEFSMVIFGTLAAHVLHALTMFQVITT